MKENAIGTIGVDRAVKLHRDSRTGLLETVYEVTLARALEQRGLRVQRQVSIAIEYRGAIFDEGFRADVMVENLVILELKSVERVRSAHKKQVLTYLRLTGLRLGYLLNFGEALMRDGIPRIIRGTLDPDPACLRERRIYRTKRFTDRGAAASVTLSFGKKRCRCRRRNRNRDRKDAAWDLVMCGWTCTALPSLTWAGSI